MIDISDRDLAYYYLQNIDLDAQLRAIRSTLANQRKATNELANEIAEIETRAKLAKGRTSFDLSNLRVDHLHHSVYQDAANSAAAVGMLAPLLESIFLAVFRGIESVGTDTLGEDQTSSRSQRAKSQFWNGKLYFDKDRITENLPLGIAQLAKTSGLSDYLPTDFKMVIEAVFLYRNRMLHSGFEWSEEERTKFAKQLTRSSFPGDWFESSTSDGRPWIFYMSDVLIQRSLLLVDEVLEAAGKQLKMISSDAVSGDVLSN